MFTDVIYDLLGEIMSVIFISITCNTVLQSEKITMLIHFSFTFKKRFPDALFLLL